MSEARSAFVALCQVLFVFLLLFLSFTAPSWGPPVIKALSGATLLSIISCIASVAGVASAVAIYWLSERAHDQRRQQQLRISRRALAIEIEQEMRQRQMDVSVMLHDFVSSGDFDWTIPTFASFRGRLREYVDLGEEFLDCAERYRILDFAKMRMLAMDAASISRRGTVIINHLGEVLDEHERVLRIIGPMITDRHIVVRGPSGTVIL